DHVRDRHLFHLAADLVFGRQAHALLDLLEAWASFLIERDDLAVEDHLARSEGSTQRMDLRVPRCDDLPSPALQPHDAALDERDGANAVPLEFESPCVIRARQ